MPGARWGRVLMTVVLVLVVLSLIMSMPGLALR